MSGSAGSRRRSDGAGRISRSDRMVSGRRWESRGRGSLIRRFQSLRRRRRRGAGRRRGRIFQSVRIAGMGCGSVGIGVRRVIRCWSSRCRGCGRVYEGNMLRFCPACGCRLLDTPVEILPELTAEERAVCGGALRGVFALPWSGAGCRGAEVLPALRLRGLDKAESAGVLGEVLLLSLCGDPDDRSFCYDVGCEKSASCFMREPLECCRPLLVCKRGGAGSIGSEGSTGLVRCFSSS